MKHITRIFLALVLLTFSMSAEAEQSNTSAATQTIAVETTDLSSLDYAIYCQPKEVGEEEQFTLTVCMKNKNLITAWQAELVLPEGITVATDSDGDPMVALSGTRTSSSRHGVSADVLSSGTLRILCSSQSNKTFTGTDGEVLTITLNKAEGVAAGDYPIKLKNQKLVEANETGHKVELVVSLLTVKPALDPSRFDLDNDGDVDIADITVLVDYIKTHPNLSVAK